MRAIDADALIVELMDSDLDHLQRDDWKEVIQIVEDAPTIKVESHWISVKERLPEVGKTVLFCDYDRDIYVGHRAIEHWWSVDDKVKNVTAWMPLPDPWKGE